MKRDKDQEAYLYYVSRIYLETGRAIDEATSRLLRQWFVDNVTPEPPSNRVIVRQVDHLLTFTPATKREACERIAQQHKMEPGAVRKAHDREGLKETDWKLRRARQIEREKQGTAKSDFWNLSRLSVWGRLKDCDLGRKRDKTV